MATALQTLSFLSIPLLVDIDVALKEKTRMALSAGVVVVGAKASVVTTDPPNPYLKCTYPQMF